MFTTLLAIKYDIARLWMEQSISDMFTTLLQIEYDIARLWMEKNICDMFTTLLEIEYAVQQPPQAYGTDPQALQKDHFKFLE